MRIRGFLLQALVPLAHGCLAQHRREQGVCLLFVCNFITEHVQPVHQCVSTELPLHTGLTFF